MKKGTRNGFTMCLITFVYLIFCFQEEVHRVRFVGRSWPHITYIRGWDRLKPLEESLAAVPDNDEVDGM